MFGSMLGMLGNYSERVVGRYENDTTKLLVSTCRVTDSPEPYETAVCHPEYHGGDFIIVEMYPDHAAAQAGHDKWVATMTGELPDELRDVSGATLAQLVDAFSGGDSAWRIHKRNRGA